MYKDDVIKFYGTRVALAEALGISPAAISQWSDIIPERQAYRLQRLTGNTLKVNPIIYEKLKYASR